MQVYRVYGGVAIGRREGTSRGKVSEKEWKKNGQRMDK